jgi:hypothetical protein
MIRTHTICVHWPDLSTTSIHHQRRACLRGRAAHGEKEEMPLMQQRPDCYWGVVGRQRLTLGKREDREVSAGQAVSLWRTGNDDTTRHLSGRPVLHRLGEGGKRSRVGIPPSCFALWRDKSAFAGTTTLAGNSLMIGEWRFFCGLLLRGAGKGVISPALISNSKL